jgi:hypothetical protein
MDAVTGNSLVPAPTPFTQETVVHINKAHSGHDNLTQPFENGHATLE